MNSVSGLSKQDQLRARDGDDCWLCFEPINFRAVSNSKKAPTLEHLEPTSLGGSNALDNLVLCHPGCNRQLGSRPKANKLKMREKRLRRLKGKAASNPLPKVAALGASRVKAVTHATNRWRTIAAAAIASALFFAGLSLGLLLGMQF